MVVTERLLKAGICDMDDGISFMYFERCWSFQGNYFLYMMAKIDTPVRPLTLYLIPSHAGPNMGQHIFSIRFTPLPAVHLLPIVIIVDQPLK